MRTILILALMATHTLAAYTICGPADNDLAAALPADRAIRAATPRAAIENAAEGSAVLVLGREVSKEWLDRARAKRLRMYVELPAPAEAKSAKWERGVVASDFFGASLPAMRIVQLHDCRFVAPPVVGKTHLTLARVAGYDTAVYGLPAEQFPLLVETDEGTLIATTRLSEFVKSRYAPRAEWKIIWRAILKHLDPSREPPKLKIEPIVSPAYSKEEKLPADVERAAFERHAAFYRNGRVLLDRERHRQIKQLLVGGAEECPMPASATIGDGTLGMLEGYASHILPDGNQMQRTPIRADCCAEAAMVLALAGDETSKKVASNLLNFVFSAEMQTMGRLDPKHPAFGTIAWGAYSPAWMVGNYGDDNGRVILSGLAASAASNESDWDEHLLRALLANLRTTGKLGFRGDRVDAPALAQYGWKHFHDADTVNLAPHFEAALWTCYLWAYARTGDKEFLDRTLTAIRMTMIAYPKKKWRWMDNMERARMVWCLAWLVRVQDSPEHRAWLTTIANDLLAAQQPCGAIQELLRDTGGGHYQVPQSNEAYGVGESPLIQQVGDAVTDQLYATGFTLIALHEAAAATGDANLRRAEDKLAEYLCRIQVRSKKLDYLDGAWFRAFDYQRWDYWASSADMGWGAWSVEAGWGPAWIATTLALRDRSTSLWELTSSSRIADQLAKVRSDMAQNDGARPRTDGRKRGTSGSVSTLRFVT